MSKAPIFVISDLHIGDGGPRDNFAYGDRPKQFEMFLDTVAREKAELIILGDLLDFWQASLSKVIVHNRPLLDRLAELKATYILGNHDNDLSDFIGTGLLAHPLFERMKDATAELYTRTFGSRTFKFMHGHEVDPFNADPAPGWGRILAIFAGIFEDRNGSPMLQTGGSVEEVLSSFGQTMLELWNSLVSKLKTSAARGESPSPKDELTPAQNPDRATEMLGKYAADHKAGGYNVLVVGHTHNPGWIGEWYVNTGSWATTNNNVVRISPEDEKITVCEAKDGRLIPLSVNPLEDIKVPQA